MVKYAVLTLIVLAGCTMHYEYQGRSVTLMPHEATVSILTGGITSIVTNNPLPAIALAVPQATEKLAGFPSKTIESLTTKPLEVKGHGQ